jgi:hypothetical protein
MSSTHLPQSPTLVSARVPDEVVGSPGAQRIYDFAAAPVAALFDGSMASAAQSSSARSPWS